MRITKKYTGASCLGKRVYHAYRHDGKIEEMERATAELDALEKDFRLKLNQINQKRGTSDFKGSKQSSMVTTPAIDALFFNPHPHSVDQHQHQQWVHTSPPHQPQHIPATNPFSFGLPTHTPNYTNASISTSSIGAGNGMQQIHGRQDWKPTPHRSPHGIVQLQASSTPASSYECKTPSPYRYYI